MQFSGNTEYDFWGNNPQSSWLSTFMGPRNSEFVAGGWGWNQPTEEFMSQWEEGDLRKDVTVFYEVKGSFRLGSEGRAHTAFYEAASQFPWCRFVWAVLRKGGKWDLKTLDPVS